MLLLVRATTRTGMQPVDIFNLVLAVAIVILVILAVAKLLGAAIAPRATWWGLLIAAAILFVVWLIV